MARNSVARCWTVLFFDPSFVADYGVEIAPDINIAYPPKKVNKYHLKRDNFYKEISSSYHQFSGGMLVFMGLKEF